MSSSNVYERIWKLETSAKQLVLENKRKPETYADLLQSFVFGSQLPDINWPKTYQKLGMEAEYAEAIKKLAFSPENPNLWVVPMVQGITCNRVVEAFRREEVQVYTCANDLDATMKHHDRDAKNGRYIIGFLRAVEADEENKNKSANTLASMNHKGITLPERLVLGFGYYVATNEHLDMTNITLCSGSRHSDGNVPRVYWRSAFRSVCVGWCNPDRCIGSIRSRSVISLPVEQAQPA